MYEKWVKTRKLNIVLSVFIVLVLTPGTIAFGMFGLGDRKYYFISLMLILYALALMFIKFEGRRPKTRELVLIATLVALAVASRTLFYAIPFVKPVGAIVIISAIAFGSETGFFVGTLTMFVSNIFFGQGPWTPWQMFAFGIIGALTGVLYRKKVLSQNKIILAVYGFIVTIVLYGGIMNFSSLVMYGYDITWETVLAVYLSGIPVDTVHATATAFFLVIGAKPVLKKLERIKLKYDL